MVSSWTLHLTGQAWSLAPSHTRKCPLYFHSFIELPELRRLAKQLTPSVSNVVEV
jgi:hypothetical protein